MLCNFAIWYSRLCRDRAERENSTSSRQNLLFEAALFLSEVFYNSFYLSHTYSLHLSLSYSMSYHMSHKDNLYSELNLGHGPNLIPTNIKDSFATYKINIYIEEVLNILRTLKVEEWISFTQRSKCLPTCGVFL